MEEKSKTGRAIIEIEKDFQKYIISMKRTKYINKQEYIYYTLPGGHVESKETFEETTIREIKEELGINVKIDREFAHLFNEDLKRDEKFFLCSYIDGKIGTGEGPEFTNTNLKLYGKYEIVYINVNKISEYNLLPDDIKSMLAKKYSKL